MKILKNLFLFLFASILGLCSIILPPLFVPGIKLYDAPLFPLVRTGIEGFSVITVILLTVSGITIGFLKQKFAFLWGVAVVSLFPILAIFEMLVDRNSHNLWPFEFLFYGIMSIPSFIGVCVGNFVFRYKQKFCNHERNTKKE